MSTSFNHAASSDLVTLVCPCGKMFQATTWGARAGRKWCSGTCSDANTKDGRRAAIRAWRERKATR